MLAGLVEDVRSATRRPSGGEVGQRSAARVEPPIVTLISVCDLVGALVRLVGGAAIVTLQPVVVVHTPISGDQELGLGGACRNAWR